MIQVKKASGELETFSSQKVRQSLQRSSAQPKTIDKVLLHLKPKLFDGITTKEIYRHVYKLLDQYQSGHQYRYSLKPSVMSLGPSGYSFEKFIARLLNQLGFATKPQQVIQGQCVSHEIDIVAKKGQETAYVECKFHNRAGTKSNIKDALYTQARFEDIQAKHSQTAFPWLITNTKLTSQAITYGQCKKMKLLSWNYPAGEGLHTLLETHKLHPITCLSFLTSYEKQLLFNQNIVLCQDLSLMKSKKLIKLGLSKSTVDKIKSALVKTQLADS